jgi:acylphosphatase
MIRYIVHYSGHVQGVGFRMNVDRAARGFDVTGYVTNLPDGRVRLVAEGDANELKALLAAVCKQMGQYIEHAEAESSEATGEYREFKIRR